ncbi:hypothetical protein [Pectobacterium polaris]|uniref:hypothetical protein n=1 Tax=Pectobacterium polaris TaxID=2042057 RepID=UPI002406B32E|nr:hypothetical protein [Pectobacterium polaris]MDG0803662.1 hypothetical protein [Pectobacterium polaris]
MNAMPDNTIIVNDIVGNTIKLRVKGEGLINKVKGLGFSHSDVFMIKIVEDENEKLNVIRELVKLEALFSFGYGWYPSEVMAFYKEKGIYTGSYKVISWSGQSHYRIEDK